MRDVMDELAAWWRAGQTSAVGTVVGTWRSSPRQPGASMAVGPDGTVVGSVSGGCVEGAVYELAEQSRDTGMPILQRYGVSDDDAFAVGLTCGGIMDIFVERVSPESFPELGTLARDIAEGNPVAVATLISEQNAEDGTARASGRIGKRLVVWPEHVSGSLGSARLDDAVRDDARGLLRQGRTGLLHYGPDGERRGEDLTVFVISYAPQPRMIVFGAIDFAAAVARIGSFLGYRVTVCDARETFATTKRFPEADEVVVEWPHRYLKDTEIDPRTVVIVTTHDWKFDVPLLEVALRMPLAYVGALGSRRTHEDRLARLRERGLTEEELARLRSPIGLDIGSRTPEQTAVSIAAEIVLEQWGGTGSPLRVLDVPIHR